MNLLKKSIKNCLWKRQMLQGISKINTRNPFAEKLIIAVRETVAGKKTPMEKMRIKKIEELRKKYINNPQSITITDFGAGNPESNRSEKEMIEGVSHETTYGELCNASKPPLWAFLLFKLIRQFKPETGLELGTCIGISAAYGAAAQLVNGFDKKKLITLEGSESISNLAEQNRKELGLDYVSIVTGRFADTLPLVLKENQPIDYVFIDGHHEEEATWKYYTMILPYLSSNALLVFDDISWSPGMERVWEKIKSDKNIILAVDLKMIGICVTGSRSR